MAFSSLGDLHSVADSDELAIDVLESSGQSSLERFFDLLLDQSSGQRTKRLVKEIVVRIPNGKLKVADFDVDIFDLEDGGGITSRGVEFNGRLTLKNLRASVSNLEIGQMTYTESLSTEEHVSDARIL